MSTSRAAKTICDLKQWQLSNLPLQKLLYLSHMVCLGEHEIPLVSRPFEAWDLGPVEPVLYQQLKAYGSRTIPDIFPVRPYAEGDPEYAAITEVLNDIGDATPGKLVAITHWPGGAWAKRYRPGIMGIRITDEDVIDEYRKVLERSEAANAH